MFDDRRVAGMSDDDGVRQMQEHLAPLYGGLANGKCSLDFVFSHRWRVDRHRERSLGTVCFFAANFKTGACCYEVDRASRRT